MIDKKFNFINLILIFITSFSANFYYGSIGVFPIDTFAFFDSANLINKDFLPIKDFWVSNGLLVDLIQSVIFKFFGVSWSTYLVHSSFVNFIFSVFTYKFLINEGLDLKSSLFYSLSVALLAYPTVGVPFSDHHSLFLSIIAVYLMTFFFKTESKILLFTIPFILAFAFLSKQIPSSFFLILIILCILIYSILKKNYTFIILFIISSAAALFFFLFFLFINEIEVKDFFLQYILFPLTIGVERQGGLSFKIFISKLFNEYKFFLILGSILIYQVIKEYKIRKNIFNQLINSNFIFLLIIFIAIINQILMKNQNIIFFLLPILIGIIHIYINSNDNKKFKFFLIIIIIAFNIFITTKYHYRFNIDRKFMDLKTIDKSLTVDAELISKRLKGLKWVTVESQNNIKNEVQLLKDSIDYLKVNKNKSLIISYYQFILSEIDHDIYSPNRWYTKDGVSYPLRDNRYYSYYVKFYKKKLAEKEIEKIFTIYPLDQGAFNFVLDDNCFKTTKINKILYKHDLLNCFENEK